MLDDQGNPVQSQIEQNEDDASLFTIVFPVVVPALGFTTYFLQESSSKYTTLLLLFFRFG